MGTKTKCITVLLMQLKKDSSSSFKLQNGFVNGLSIHHSNHGLAHMHKSEAAQN